MISFREWVRQKTEMAGTGVILVKKDFNNPDYQIWGAPGAVKPKKKKKRK